MLGLLQEYAQEVVWAEGHPDEYCFAVKSKITKRWHVYSYMSLRTAPAKWLYRRIVGGSSSINLRRCHWGGEECPDCLECVSGFDEGEDYFSIYEIREYE